MLTFPLLQPDILRALGTAGHGAQVLIADGNYPVVPKSNPNATRVYLNLAPGIVTVTDVLKVLVQAIPIEAAQVMGPSSDAVPSVYSEFQSILPEVVEMQRLGRHEFYDAASVSTVALAIATGEQRVYANILLTIGVIAPPDGKL
jgi:L-fucose mutarotase